MAKVLLVISASFPEENFLGLRENSNWKWKKKFSAPRSEDFFAVWRQKVPLSLVEKLSGVVVHQGAGSFSGLRLSATVANALRLAFPKLKLFVAEGKTLKDFLRQVEQGKFRSEKKFIMPRYPQPPSIHFRS